MVQSTAPLTTLRDEAAFGGRLPKEPVVLGQDRRRP
jgi:hypothetical protein